MVWIFGRTEGFRGPQKKLSVAFSTAPPSCVFRNKHYLSIIGIDPIWFGIYAVIVIECAQTTLPVGFNLIVLKSMTGRETGEIA